MNKIILNNTNVMEDKDLYRVLRVYRNTGRRQVIERNLTRDQAIRLVNSFPNNDKSMVVFTKQ